MAAVMLQVVPSFYTNYSKNSLFISANTSEENILNKRYSISRHNDKLCFLPNCRYNIIILLGNVDELLQKLGTFCFPYQHVDCLHTLFRYHFSGKNAVKCRQLFDILQRAVHFNQQNRAVDRMPRIAKKILLKKKFKKHLFSSFQKTKTTQISGSVFAERIEKVKKATFEWELIKIVDCFLDGHGNYDINLVSFEKNLCKTNRFLNSKICIKQLIVQMI